MTDSDDLLAKLTAAQEIADKTKTLATHWSPELVKYLSIYLLAFTCFSLILCSILLYRASASGAVILRAFGIILIVSMSSLLLVVGYSDSQLTPIVGLFGAIAGYLLGKDTKSE